LPKFYKQVQLAGWTDWQASKPELALPGAQFLFVKQLLLLARFNIAAGGLDVVDAPLV